MAVSTQHIYINTHSSFCITLYLHHFPLSCLEVRHVTHLLPHLKYTSPAFDQDINAKAGLAFPQLYIRGIRGLEYTRTKFWLYMADGLYQSVIVFFIPYLVWTVGSPNSWNGRGINSLADFGTTVAVAAIFSANTYVGLNTH